MIIKNQSSEVGDVLWIKTDTPLIGLIALYSFVDETVGEYTDRSFKKTFRYSIDGINYTQYVDLTNDNIAGVQVQANDTFYAEYRYERIGLDPTGILEFDSVTLNGQFILPTDGPSYLASNFSNYFVQNNICSIAWSVNVLEKLYKKGIIPAFIERGLTGENIDDRDYIDFWRAITHYFALYVCLARQFQYFYQNSSLILEFLEQKGLFVCHDTSYQDLYYLMQNYYDEVRQRGTRQVFEPKASDTTVSGSKQVDGEFLRLICYDNRDEFLRNINKTKHIGWNIGNSSPLYRGLEDRLNLNKYYVDFMEQTIDIAHDLSVDPSYLPYLSLSDSSTSNSSSISNSNSSSASDDVLIISNPGNGNKAGIGNGSKTITVNPNIDYGISFFVKVVGDNLQGITFGVNAYDKDDNIKSLLVVDTLVSSNDFFVQQKMINGDKFFFVRGIIYNKNNYKEYNPAKSYLTGSIVKLVGVYYRAKRDVPINGTAVDGGIIDAIPGTTSSDSPFLWNFWKALTTSEINKTFNTTLGVGNNLVFVDDVVKIDPYILYDNVYNSVNSVNIYNIRVQPLSTKYSKGFLNLNNYMDIWVANNNKRFTEFDIQEITCKYLIPYNTVLKINFLESGLR